MRTGLKVLLGVGVLALVAAVAVVALGGEDGEDEADPGSPVGVVQTFYDAAERNDCEGMVAVLSEDTWSEGGTLTLEEAITDCENRPAEDMFPQGADFDFDLESQSGDTALVNVDASYRGDSVTLPLSLVREDGQWRISGREAAEGPTDPSS